MFFQFAAEAVVRRKALVALPHLPSVLIMPAPLAIAHAVKTRCVGFACSMQTTALWVDLNADSAALGNSDTEDTEFSALPALPFMPCIFVTNTCNALHHALLQAWLLHSLIVTLGFTRTGRLCVLLTQMDAVYVCTCY